MKKRFLTLLLVICLIVPCAIIFAACVGGNKVESLSFQYGNQKSEHVSIEYTYDEQLTIMDGELKLFAKYTDGTEKQVPANETIRKFYYQDFSAPDKTEVTSIPTIRPDVGVWTLEVTYEGCTATLRITINPGNGGGLLTPKLYINGEQAGTSIVYQENYEWNDSTYEFKLFDNQMNDKSDLISFSHIITEAKYKEIIGPENNYANLRDKDLVDSVVDSDYETTVFGLGVGSYYIYTKVWPYGNYESSVSKFTPITVTPKRIQFNSEDWRIVARYQYSQYSEEQKTGEIKLSEMGEISIEYLGDFDQLTTEWTGMFVIDGEKRPLHVDDIGHFEFTFPDRLVDSRYNGSKAPVKMVYEGQTNFVVEGAQAELEIRRGEIQTPYYSSENPETFIYQNVFNGTKWVPEEKTVILNNDVNENGIDKDGYQRLYRLRPVSSYGITNSAIGNYAREYELIDPINFYWVDENWEEITEETYADSLNMEYVNTLYPGNPIMRIRWSIIPKEYKEVDQVNGTTRYPSGMLRLYDPEINAVTYLNFMDHTTSVKVSFEGVQYLTLGWNGLYIPESLEALAEQISIKVFKINDDLTRTDVTNLVLSNPSLYLESAGDSLEEEYNHIPNWKFDFKAVEAGKYAIVLEIGENGQIPSSSNVDIKEVIIEWKKIDLTDDTLQNPVFIKDWASRWDSMVEFGVTKLSDRLGFLKDYEEYFTYTITANGVEVDLDTFVFEEETTIIVTMTVKEGYENLIQGGSYPPIEFW